MDLQTGGPDVPSHTRERLGGGGRASASLDAVASEARTAGLGSEHFGVGGTLAERFASAKSFRPIPALPAAGSPGDSGSPTAPPAEGNGFTPGDPETDLRCQERTISTHLTRTDPEARLFSKGPDLGEVQPQGSRAEREQARAGAGGDNNRAERTAALEVVNEL